MLHVVPGQPPGTDRRLSQRWLGPCQGPDLCSRASSCGPLRSRKPSLGRLKALNARSHRRLAAEIGIPRLLVGRAQTSLPLAEVIDEGLYWGARGPPAPPGL